MKKQADDSIVVKKKKRYKSHPFFEKCKNPSLSADIAFPYAKRRLLNNDRNPHGMYADWAFHTQNVDFQEAIAAMEYFIAISAYPDLFFDSETLKELNFI